MDIVVVEDDAINALFIEGSLRNLGHNVLDSFDEGQAVIDFAKNHKIDLVFMDIEINGSLDGIQTARILYEKYQIPVIYISSYQDTDTIENAADTLPISYLIKPVQESDIKAVLAIAKRSILKKPKESKMFSYKTFTFNVENMTLSCDAHIIKLSMNELKLVELLFKNQNAVVSIEALVSYIWGSDTDKEQSLRELVYRVRKKLPDLEIKALSKIGYTIS